MARVSVVVQSANRKDELRATVESVLRQTLQDYELIVADDGSTDGTGPLMLNLLGPDPARTEQVWRDSLNEESGTRSIQMTRGGVPVRYLHTITPRGTAAARNRALASASAEYVAFAEPGDVWSTHKLEWQVGLMDQNRDIPAAIQRPLPAGVKPTPKKKPTLAVVDFDEALSPPGLFTSGSIVRRACMDWEGPFDENLPACEEYDFWLRLASRFQIGAIQGALQTSGAVRSASSWSLDRYRVYSMEKAFQGGHLNPIQRHRIAAALVDRCARLANGYRQRENLERANFYERKRKRFISEVTKLELSDPLFLQARRERRLSGTTA